MAEWNSPYYADGCADGARDTLAASSCPPGVPLGPNGAQAWSVMYNRGYERTYNPDPCPCDGSCKRGKSYGEAPDRDADNTSESGSGAVDYWYGGDEITV